LAVQVCVGCGELCHRRLACCFGNGKFLGSGSKVVLVAVGLVDGSQIGMVSSLLCRSMHSILYVVGLREAPL
jgi:hypothetical protein